MKNHLEFATTIILFTAAFLATILKYASSSPIHNGQYIYLEINSRLLTIVSSISLEQYLIDAVYHHTHASTLPKVGLEPP